MTKPSYEELRITKHSGSPQSADSASRSTSDQMARENRCDCKDVDMHEALTLLVEFIEPVDGNSFVPKRDMAHLKILVQHAKKALLGTAPVR